MDIFTTRRFEKDARSLPKEKQTQLFKSLELLLKDPLHPSSHLKPMQGCINPQIWEIRISGGYRLTHDILKKP